MFVNYFHYCEFQRHLRSDTVYMFIIFNDQCIANHSFSENIPVYVRQSSFSINLQINTQYSKEEVKKKLEKYKQKQKESKQRSEMIEGFESQVSQKFVHCVLCHVNSKQICCCLGLISVSSNMTRTTKIVKMQSVKQSEGQLSFS